MKYFPGPTYSAEAAVAWVSLLLFMSFYETGTIFGACLLFLLTTSKFGLIIVSSSVFYGTNRYDLANLAPFLTLSSTTADES